MFQENVFCFTPKGAVIKLPMNATPIDFAYAVHTKIGDSAIGCFVNGTEKTLIKMHEEKNKKKREEAKILKQTTGNIEKNVFMMYIGKSTKDFFLLPQGVSIELYTIPGLKKGEIYKDKKKWIDSIIL